VAAVASIRGGASAAPAPGMRCHRKGALPSMLRMQAVGCVAGLLAVAGGAHAPRGVPKPCDAPEYREFDFFAGEWDAYEIGTPEKLIGRNSVTPMVGGCALREVYRQNDGLQGESFSVYDARRRVWHQSWVTNRGQLLLLDGKLEGGRMVLTGTDRATDGESAVIRGTWSVVSGGVRETAERSVDGGRTWSPVFDMVFRPRAAGGH
jgi:hypothetical protein